MNAALRLPTGVPPLYTFTVTVQVPCVVSGSSSARDSGTIHWYTTHPALLLIVRSAPPLSVPEAAPSA